MDLSKYWPPSRNQTVMAGIAIAAVVAVGALAATMLMRRSDRPAQAAQFLSTAQLTTDPQAAPSGQDGICRALVSPPPGDEPNDADVICECGRQYFDFVARRAADIEARGDQRMARLGSMFPINPRFLSARGYDPKTGKAYFNTAETLRGYGRSHLKDCWAWDYFYSHASQAHRPAKDYPSRATTAFWGKTRIYGEVEEITGLLWSLTKNEFDTRVQEIQLKQLNATWDANAVLFTKLKNWQPEEDQAAIDQACLANNAQVNQLVSDAVTQIQALGAQLRLERDKIAAPIRLWDKAAKRDGWPRPEHRVGGIRALPSLEEFAGNFFETVGTTFGDPVFKLDPDRYGVTDAESRRLEGFNYGVPPVACRDITPPAGTTVSLGAPYMPGTLIIDPFKPAPLSNVMYALGADEAELP